MDQALRAIPIREPIGDGHSGAAGDVKLARMERRGAAARIRVCAGRGQGDAFRRVYHAARPQAARIRETAAHEEIVTTRFDYREMSKRTLAAHWSRRTEPKRTEFVESFKRFLSDRYAGTIRDYAGEQVEYLGERLEGDYAEIRTRLVSSKTNYPLDYRLINKDGRWHAYDLVVDGVSLVKNYRSQFDRIIRAESYEELVRRMNNRSLAEEQKTKPE